MSLETRPSSTSPLPSAVNTGDPATERPATDRLDVSVVLPCLNEQDSVAACVHEALEAIAANGWTGEVVVVDNGSTDRSAEVARAAGARVVPEPIPGYGAAIRRGITAALGNVVVMADADSTYPLDRLGELVEPVRRGDADLMIGSRLHAATRQSMPLLHRFVGTPTLTWLVREGVGASNLSDSQSGFRAFGVDLAERIGLRSTGMEFASEMLIRAQQHGLVIEEIPLGYRDRVGESKLSTWRDGWRHLRLILRLSPQILLWKPGLIAMVLGLATYATTIVWPSGLSIGSVSWQPVFFGTILWTAGVVAALSGALLARWSPTASVATRLRFAWVDRESSLTTGIRGGIAMVAAGLLLEIALFGAWLSGPGDAATRRLALAGLAQGLLLSGMILTAVLVVYRLLLAEHGELVVDDPLPDADLPDGSGTTPSR